MTEEALNNIAETTARNIRDFFEGLPSPNAVCSLPEREKTPQHQRA